MSLPSPTRSGSRRPRAELALVALLAVALSGCLYSFTGGGLPRHIRTIAVLQFDNETTQGQLAPELLQLLQQELPRKLGVRIANEATADAIVRGRITDFNETAPGFRPGSGAGAIDRGIQVTQREVQISVTMEIYDVREDRVLWQGSGVRGQGQYNPDRGVQTGITLALRELVNRVIDGAQSQW